MKFKIYILFIIIFKSYFTFSQNTLTYKNDIFFEVRYQNGFIYKHATAINRLVKGNISAIDINLGWQTKGISPWQQLYRYPKAGVGLYYSMLNYPEVLGNAIAGYGFVNIPLINIKNNYILSYQTAFGAAYVTKVYDENALVQNDAYSTHLNIYFDFSVDVSIRIYKQFSFITALGITHYSNGAVKMPNLGLNTITRQFGINYHPAYQNKKRNKLVFEKPKQRNELWIFYSPAVKKLPSKGKTLFFASSMAINYAYRINQKRKLGIGLDIFYDESLKYVYTNAGVDYKNIYRFRPGYHLSQDLMFGKISFLLETGWYFTTHYEDDYTFYHRLGLKYQFAKNFFLLYALKTHWATADYMELAIGSNVNW